MTDDVETPVDLPVEEPPETRACERCTLLTQQFSLTDEWLCRVCAHELAVEQDAARELRRAERDRARSDGQKLELKEMIANGLRALEESPHRCSAGCGEHMLRPDSLCGACDAKRRAIEEQKANLIATRIPKRLRWATFDAPELGQRVKDQAAIAKVKTAAIKGLDRLVLQGPAGVGKSVLATCALRQIMGEHGQYAGRFFDGFEISIARAHSGLGDEAPDVASAMGAGILAFDDVGSGKNSSHDATADVIFRRHADERPTVYTTGFSLEELRGKYGDGICRRIFENAIVIDMGATRSGK
jgi:DNA replication protein DnaC